MKQLIIQMIILFLVVFNSNASWINPGKNEKDPIWAAAATNYFNKTENNTADPGTTNSFDVLTAYGFLDITGTNTAGYSGYFDGGIWVGQDLGYGILTGITFGDGDSGFFETSDDTVYARLGGQNCYAFREADLFSLVAGGFYLQKHNYGVAYPTYGFNGDTDSGLFRAGDNTPAMAAGATTSMVWTTTGVIVPKTLSFATQTNHPSAYTDGGQVYCVSNEVYAMDSSGNFNVLSPHPSWADNQAVIIIEANVYDDEITYVLKSDFVKVMTGVKTPDASVVKRISTPNYVKRNWDVDEQRKVEMSILCRAKEDARYDELMVGWIAGKNEKPVKIDVPIYVRRQRE